MKKPQPAYQQIKQAILSNIHSGQWKAGDAIPTEMALTEQFGVSRMTVNRALKELSEEKVLERRQGSGTFVAQQHFNHTFVEVRNIAHDIQADNHHYLAKVLEKTTVDFAQLPQAVQQQFLLANQAAVDRIALVKIVHYADGVPLQLEERWVDMNLVKDFLEQDFTQVNTSDFLISRVPLERGEYTISAQFAPLEVVTALKMSKDEPALLLNRLTFSQGHVVTVVNMWHAGNRYQFHGKL